MALFSSIASFLGQAEAQKRRFSDMAEFRELVIDAHNPQAQSAARQMIDVRFKDGFNLVSDKIFERRNGKLLAQV